MKLHCPKSFSLFVIHITLQFLSWISLWQDNSILRSLLSIKSACLYVPLKFVTRINHYYKNCIKSVAWSEAVVTPLLTQWSYHSHVLSHENSDGMFKLWSKVSLACNLHHLISCRSPIFWIIVIGGHFLPWPQLVDCMFLDNPKSSNVVLQQTIELSFGNRFQFMTAFLAHWKLLLHNTKSALNISHWH